VVCPPWSAVCVECVSVVVVPGPINEFPLQPVDKRAAVRKITFTAVAAPLFIPLVRSI
jgi:hypothetical protein